MTRAFRGFPPSHLLISPVWSPPGSKALPLSSDYEFPEAGAFLPLLQSLAQPLASTAQTPGRGGELLRPVPDLALGLWLHMSFVAGCIQERPGPTPCLGL